MTKVMHVEDEPDTRKVVKEILESEGYKVTSYPNGEKGVAAVKKDKPDIILLDVMMPGMSGWDAFERIKKIDKKAKIAFLTVLEVSPERLAVLKKAGLSDYINKPFTATELVSRVRKMAKP